MNTFDDLPPMDSNNRYIDLQIRIQVANLIVTQLQGAFLDRIQEAAKTDNPHQELYASGGYEALEIARKVYDEAIFGVGDLMEWYQNWLQENMKAGES